MIIFINTIIQGDLIFSRSLTISRELIIFINTARRFNLFTFTNDIQRIGSTGATGQNSLDFEFFFSVVSFFGELQLVDCVILVDVYSASFETFKYFLFSFNVVETGYFIILIIWFLKGVWGFMV